MAEDFYSRIYNPDVLSCIANLSNDEVFTPPGIANQVLDMLPQELFQNPETKFLDPACKSGVFLREIAKRLIKGLKPQIPDLQQRIDHIFQHQLFGIAITELTSLLSRRSLYCSKYPNSIYSVTSFDDAQGNIRFKHIQHQWKNGNCVFCGASQGQYDREVALETHAYELIHTTRPEEIFKMKFDVIIGNPPYQLSTNGAQAQAIPIYNKFVLQAIKLNPRYLSFIIPARWFTGGFGLDSFRTKMVNDKSIRILHDFINSTECFGTGVEIKGGVCYFLWDREYKGKCKISTHENGVITSTSERYLNAEGFEVFIRRNEAISIFEKVKAKNEDSFKSMVSSQRPFGLSTNYVGRSSRMPEDISLYGRNLVSYIERSKVTQSVELIDKFKIYITKGYNGGDNFPHQIINKPILGEKGSCCTETYIVVGPFENRTEAENTISYINTRFFRFLVSLMKNTQDSLKKVYTFVPKQDFSKKWTDIELYEKYNLNDDEIAFIESMIKPMDQKSEDDGK